MYVGIGVAALVIGVAAFAFGIGDGGDAKLFAAVALYMGSLNIAPYVFDIAIAGGILAMIFMVLHQPRLKEWTRRLPVLAQIVLRGMAIPYGVAIVAGRLLAFPSVM